MSDVKVGEQFSTLRDEFAARAMQAMMPFHQMKTMQVKMQMQSGELNGNGGGAIGGTSQMTGGDFNFDELAADAYQMADAMLRAREVKKVDVAAMAGERCAVEGCTEPPESNLTRCRGHEMQAEDPVVTIR